MSQRTLRLRSGQAATHRAACRVLRYAKTLAQDDKQNRRRKRQRGNGAVWLGGGSVQREIPRPAEVRRDFGMTPVKRGTRSDWSHYLLPARNGNDCASDRLLVTFFRSKIRSAHGVLSATDARIEQASPPFLETDLTACVKPANVVLDAQSCASAQLRMSGSVLGEMQGR